MASVFLFFLHLLSIFSPILASPNTVSLSLSPIHTQKPSLNTRDYISHITKSTINRAHHIKAPHKNRASPVPSPVLHKTEEVPLHARSYGGYSVSLSFGTPPQAIPLVFDTGSSLTWVPCTSRYLCQNCSFSSIDPSKIPKFIPRLSSTTKIIGCRNPQCGWLYGPGASGLCSGCPGPERECNRACPAYILQYGLGSTSGLAISDNLDLPGGTLPGFFLGCSVLSLRQPSGIAGFGRAPTSVPAQLKLRGFSYCLLSHRFDDEPKESELVLAGNAAGKSAGKVAGVKYTPFGKNPAKSPYDEYYYLHLRKITVGKKRVKLPYKYLVPGPEGNGGTIIDSGSTLTFMDPALYGPLVAELAAQTGQYKRARDVEAQTGFGLCLDFSHSDTQHKNFTFPELVFHFKGGAKMELAAENTFSFVDDVGSLCLTIVTSTSPVGPSGPVGPAIMLGNYQQMNFYIEYDLENQRLGFKRQKCG